MKTTKFVFVLLIIISHYSCAVLAAQTPAETVFINGNIYTVNAVRPQAEAIAVVGGKIVFVGTNREVKSYQGKNTRTVDLRGLTVVPGLTDAHYHLAGVGEREMNLNLEGTTSLEDFLGKVKQRVEGTERGKWITGRGWIETFWQPPVFPSRQDLDRIAPHNPVFLTRADGHAGVVNSEALRIAGLTKQTPNPFGGDILKDKQTNDLTGMLIDAAQRLVAKHIPARTEAELEQALLIGAQRSLELGWCQIHNAGSTYAEAEMLKRLTTEGKIRLRIYNAVSGPGAHAERLLKEGASLAAHAGAAVDNRFTMRTIKVHFDGALGSRGAALIEPYADAATSGFLTVKEDALYPMLVSALRQGVQVETHAIGDRTNRVILDLYERAFKEVPPTERKVREPRWRVEHAQIISRADLPRFTRLGVIASMQPSHAISDLFFAPSRLGQERLAGAYAWQDLLQSGAIIAGGSDAPVERGEPMIEFYAAVARKDQKGFSAAGWHPEQRATREQALKMFTLWAAYAAFEENIKGSIEPGKLADLTVLSADIMKIPEADILKTKCVMTVVGGEIAFKNF